MRTTSNKVLADSLDSCVDESDSHVNKVWKWSSAVVVVLVDMVADAKPELLSVT